MRGILSGTEGHFENAMACRASAEGDADSAVQHNGPEPGHRKKGASSSHGLGEFIQYVVPGVSGRKGEAAGPLDAARGEESGG